MGTAVNARELFLRHHSRYEVSPSFEVLDVGTPGVTPSKRKVQVGFDVDVFGNGFPHSPMLSIEDGELRAALKDLSDACQEAVRLAAGDSRIEVIPFEENLFLNVKRHLDPEALVRIRITRSAGFDQPAGAAEEKALAAVIDGLRSMGVQRT